MRTSYLLDSVYSFEVSWSSYSNSTDSINLSEVLDSKIHTCVLYLLHGIHEIYISVKFYKFYKFLTIDVDDTVAPSVYVNYLRFVRSYVLLQTRAWMSIQRRRRGWKISKKNRYLAARRENHRLTPRCRDGRVLETPSTSGRLRPFNSLVASWIRNRAYRSNFRYSMPSIETDFEFRCFFCRVRYQEFWNFWKIRNNWN